MMDEQPWDAAFAAVTSALRLGIIDAGERHALLDALDHSDCVSREHQRAEYTVRMDYLNRAMRAEAERDAAIRARDDWRRRGDEANEHRKRAERERDALRADNERLREQLDEAHLARIESQNPGIDIERVREQRTEGVCWACHYGAEDPERWNDRHTCGGQQPIDRTGLSRAFKPPRIGSDDERSADSEAAIYLRRNLARIMDHLPSDMEAKRFAAMVDCVLAERSAGWRAADEERDRAEREREQRDEAREDHERLRKWAVEAAQALHAATVIGQRSCRDGDHPNYANHDRLIRELNEMSGSANEERT